MAPGWKGPSGGACLFKPSQDSAISADLYAVQERFKKTREVKEEMQTAQDAIALAVDELNAVISTQANEYDGIIAHGDHYLVQIELLSRATIPYTFQENTEAWDTMGELSFVGFSGKRGNLLFARSTTATGNNVNLDDGSTKELELIALPSMKKESFATLIPSNQMSGDFIKQLKRFWYAPPADRPPTNPAFGSLQECHAQLRYCMDFGLVPEPYILSPDARTPLSADTLRVDKLPCLYGTWRRLSYDRAKAILTPAVHQALLNFFGHHATDTPLDMDLVVEACIVTRFIEAHMPLIISSKVMLKLNSDPWLA
ncbi:hypothetical protein PG993_006153 [Apiospora rasikravindrae]|uniref:Uncharacterized protein n=1 Tax=Apiospora rasikravindrae TaxID=990691 RepID=A0ABR1T6Q8_9PEZI